VLPFCEQLDVQIRRDRKGLFDDLRNTLTYDEFNQYCKSLSATTYVSQWGGSHVWKVGGKVFAVGGWENDAGTAISFKVSEGDFVFMQEEAGFRGAPYMASRGMKWIQIYDMKGIENAELESYLNNSYRLVWNGLTKKKQRELTNITGP